MNAAGGVSTDRKLSRPQILRIEGPPTLLEVCSRGEAKGVEDAIRRGEDANQCDADGNTPLILAAQAGYTSIIDVLIENFPLINLDQTNNNGQTALMKAAVQGRVQCARTLLRAGADPYRRDLIRGLCALQWAEYVGRTECARMIAHFMLQPVSPAPVKPKSPQQRRKLSFVSATGFQALTRVAAVPLMGDVQIPPPRQRTGSAPTPQIPRLEVNSHEALGRKHSHGSALLRRPPTSFA